MDMSDKYTRVTVEVHDNDFSSADRKVTWEIPDAYPSGEDMLDMLRTVMVGMTFSEKTFYDTVRDYVIENRSWLFSEEEFNSLFKDSKSEEK